MPPTLRNIQLDEAIALPGCPVCRMVAQRVSQTLESIQDELVLDPAYRERVDSAWGFCTVHAQQWLEQAQPLSTAIIYEAVLGRIDRELDRSTPGRSGAAASLRARLPGVRGNRPCEQLVESRVCPLCVARAEQERQVIAQLLDELRADSFRERYLGSHGLCVVHLNLALCAGPDAAALATVRIRMQRTHQALRDHLREVIRKHDYRYRDEVAGPEWGAVEQAVRQVAGAPGIDRRAARSEILDEQRQ